MHTQIHGLTVPQQKIVRFLEERERRGEGPPTYREICKHFGYSSTKAAADHVAALERKGFVIRDKKRARGIRLVRKALGVPLLGRVVAGLPREALAETGNYLALDPTTYGIRDQMAAFGLVVSGDSMIGRHIAEGDIVLLDHGAIPKDGDIVAALVDNESTLKTFVRRGSETWLHAENPDYSDLRPAFDMQIQGVGRAVIRFLNK